MNYIKEMNAFYDWLETNELSPSAINLWYALLHINNKAGWAQSFAVAESVLLVKTGLSDRTIRKARAELKEKNRIDFVSRSGGRAPVYSMIPFYPTTAAAVDLHSDKLAVKAKPIPAKCTTIVEVIVSVFHHDLNPAQLQLMLGYLEQHKMTEELIIWVINDTAQRGKSFEYARSILNRLCEKKILTVEEALTDRENYKARMQKNNARKNARPFRKHRSGSPVPEWVGDPQQSLESFKPESGKDNRTWLEGILEGI